MKRYDLFLVWSNFEPQNTTSLVRVFLRGPYQGEREDPRTEMLPLGAAVSVRPDLNSLFLMSSCSFRIWYLYPRRVATFPWRVAISIKVSTRIDDWI